MDSTNINNYTPMMQQYMLIKQNYPDTLVFYRMGDFYEMFFEDAELGSQLLGITLTKRGSVNNEPIKMAGVPFHSVDQYLVKLVNQNQSVVIVDQIGEVNGKGPVERKVTRVITPGTLTDSNLLNDKNENCVASIFCTKKEYGIAYLSISSGKFYLLETKEFDIATQLERICPSELIIPESLNSKIKELNTNISIKRLPDWHFEYQTNFKKLCTHFATNNLDGFGINSFKSGISAAGVLLDYVKQTQCNDLPHITKLIYDDISSFLQIDAISRRNLEITTTINNSDNTTLFSLMDKCSSQMGSRMLKNWLNHPLRNHELINQRYNAINKITPMQDDIHQLLKQICDIERITSRIALNTAKPRDLTALRDTLEIIPQLCCLLLQIISAQDNNNIIMQINQQLNNINNQIYTILSQAILNEPNLQIRDGNVINHGYNEELDKLRNIASSGQDFLTKLETQERIQTGINNLKIEYNRVHGYYIEISKIHTSKVPDYYKRTQTLKLVERYTTTELKNYESEVLSASDKALAIEKKLYNEVLEFLRKFIDQLYDLANSISQLDVINAFSKVAKLYNFNQANLVTNDVIDIKGGRHPVVERKITQFIENDVNLETNNKFLIITGPNMGGKSTYMRQTAIIVLLAYCGSFVPANSATIGIIDKIFTRIGASDDLSNNKSTFMLEMTETANILNNATKNSLIIMDEIGRGTSTFDGLSLAYSISRYLIEKLQSYTMFATHYFELTTLADDYDMAKNVHLSAIEHQDKIVFLHHVQDGAATKSYGIQVASLAGIPKSVINLAKKYLAKLENKQDPTDDLFSPDLSLQVEDKEQQNQHKQIYSVNNNLTLRSANHNDINSLIKIFSNDMLGKTRENIINTLDYTNAFEEIIKFNNIHLLVVETSDKQIIGTMQLIMIPCLAINGSKRLEIESVHVKSEFRNQQIGSWMIHEAIKFAKDNHCKIIQLTSNNKRLDAHRFYERLGFVNSHAGMKLYL